VTFRDRAWRSRSEECLTESCDRKVTEDVRAAARRWWGGPDAPFSLMDMSSRCGAYRPKA
jgi:hypothetical protein